MSRKICLPLILSLGCAVAGAVLPATAATHTVFGDVIEFNCPTSTCTITLSGPLPPMTASMTIDGGTPGKIIVHGADAWRAFFAHTGTIAISNLTIRNAKATGGTVPVAAASVATAATAASAAVAARAAVLAAAAARRATAAAAALPPTALPAWRCRWDLASAAAMAGAEPASWAAPAAAR